MTISMLVYVILCNNAIMQKTLQISISHSLHAFFLFFKLLLQRYGWISMWILFI